MGNGRRVRLEDVMTFAMAQTCTQLLRHPTLSYEGVARILGITRQGVHKHARDARRKFPALDKHLHRRRGRPSNRPILLSSPTDN